MVVGRVERERGNNNNDNSIVLRAARINGVCTRCPNTVATRKVVAINVPIDEIEYLFFNTHTRAASVLHYTSHAVVVRVARAMFLIKHNP